jgi:hypothetical protein
MVLLKIDTRGVLSVPLKGDAPWSIDVHSVAHGLAAQPMKIEAGNIHFLGPKTLIETRKTQPDSFDQIGAHF